MKRGLRLSNGPVITGSIFSDWTLYERTQKRPNIVSRGSTVTIMTGNYHWPLKYYYIGCYIEGI
jgi:hypothetical protein